MMKIVTRTLGKKCVGDWSRKILHRFEGFCFFPRAPAQSKICDELNPKFGRLVDWVNLGQVDSDSKNVARCGMK